MTELNAITTLAVCVATIATIGFTGIFTIWRAQKRIHFKRMVEITSENQGLGQAIISLIQKLDKCESMGDVRRAVEKMKGHPMSNRQQRRGKVLVPESK